MFRLTLTALAATSFLAACGGGGGGSSVNASTASPLAITSANYDAAGVEAVSSSFYLTSSSSLATGVEGQAETGMDTLINFGKSQIPSLGKWVSSAGVLPTGVTESFTEDCPGGGTLTGSATVAVAGTLSAQDSINLSGSNCVLNDGSIISGALNFRINSLIGDYANSNFYTINITLTYNNLTSGTAARTVTGNGDITLATVAAGVNYDDTTISSSSFTATANYSGTTYSRSLANYLATISVRPNGAGYIATTSISGMIASSALGGNRITIATVAPFVRISPNLYPGSGQATATGSGLSKVLMTVQNTSSVRLELDADGNGIYETSKIKTWASLI